MHIVTHLIAWTTAVEHAFLVREPPTFSACETFKLPPPYPSASPYLKKHHALTFSPFELKGHYQKVPAYDTLFIFHQH